jgi:hypothetical protein
MPAEAALPLPMMVSEPSRPTSPMSATDLARADVDGDEDHLPIHDQATPSRSSAKEAAPDERHVLEDPEPETDERDQVRSRPGPDECEEDRDQGVMMKPLMKIRSLKVPQLGRMAPGPNPPRR